MALVKTFCVVFSLRLGVIIIAIITLIVSCIFLTLASEALLDSLSFSKNLQDVAHKIPLLQSIAEKIQLTDEICIYAIAFAIFYILMVLSCIFLLMAAYQCKQIFAFSFLFLDLVHLALLFLYMVILCLYTINDSDGMGTIILYFCIVYFILAFLVYSWICVYSFVQITASLEKQVIRRIKLNLPPKYGAKIIIR